MNGTGALRAKLLFTASLITASAACEDEPFALAVGTGESTMRAQDIDAGLGSAMRDAGPDGGPLRCYETHAPIWSAIVGDAGHLATACARDGDCVPAPATVSCPERQALVSLCPWPIAASHLDAALRSTRALSLEYCPHIPLRCLNTVPCPRFETRCIDRQCRAVLLDAGR